MPSGHYARSMAEIAMAAGNAQADNARRKGDIWGGVISSMGQIPLQMQAMQRQRSQDAMVLEDRTRQRQLADAQMANLTRDDERAGRAERRADMTAITAAETAALDQNLKKLELVGRLFGGVNDQTSYEAVVGQVGQLGADTSKFPKQYSQGFVKSQMYQAMTLKEQIEATRPDLQNVPAGTSVIDKRNPQAGVVFTAPTDPDKAADNTRAEAAQAETVRHNRAMERINAMQAGRSSAAQAETERHNRAMESAAKNQKVTGAQRKVLGFFNRMLEAERNARAVEDSVGGRDFAAEFMPGEWLENLARSDAGQKYTQSQRTFTEGRLRKESGAAIPSDEYEKDRSTNFKRPNDTSENVAQKRAARLTLLKGAANEAGKAFQEFYGEEASIDDLLSEFTDTVKMKAPDGTVKDIPASDVGYYKSRGATVVGQ